MEPKDKLLVAGCAVACFSAVAYQCVAGPSVKELKAGKVLALSKARKTASSSPEPRAQVVSVSSGLPRGAEHSPLPTHPEGCVMECRDVPSRKNFIQSSSARKSLKKRNESRLDATTQTNRHWFSDDMSTQTVNDEATNELNTTFFHSDKECTSQDKMDGGLSHEPIPIIVPPVQGLSLSVVGPATAESSPRFSSEMLFGLYRSQMVRIERLLHLLIEEVNIDKSNPRSWMTLYFFLNELPGYCKNELLASKHRPSLAQVEITSRSPALLSEVAAEVQAIIEGQATLCPEKRYAWEGTEITAFSEKRSDSKAEALYRRFGDLMVCDSDDEALSPEDRTTILERILKKYSYIAEPGKGVQCPEEEIVPAPVVNPIPEENRELEEKKPKLSQHCEEDIRLLADTVLHVAKQAELRAIQRAHPQFAARLEELQKLAQRFVPKKKKVMTSKVEGAGNTGRSKSDKLESKSGSISPLNTSQINSPFALRQNSGRLSKANTFERLYSSPLRP